MKGLNVSAAELRSASRTAAPTWFPAPGSPGRTVAQRSRRSGMNRSDPVGSGARTCSLPARTFAYGGGLRAGSGLPVHLTGQTDVPHLAADGARVAPGSSRAAIVAPVVELAWPRPSRDYRQRA